MVNNDTVSDILLFLGKAAITFRLQPFEEGAARNRSRKCKSHRSPEPNSVAFVGYAAQGAALGLPTTHACFAFVDKSEKGNGQD